MQDTGGGIAPLRSTASASPGVRCAILGSTFCMQKIKRVQRQATKLRKGLEIESYEGGLKELGMQKRCFKKGHASSLQVLEVAIKKSGGKPFPSFFKSGLKLFI